MEALLVAAGAVLASARMPSGKGARAAAQPDEDAVTLAAEAAAAALPEDFERPQTLFLASTTAPYAKGGSVQPLAELLGLQGRLFSSELTASARDGIAALRLAVAVAAASGPVLVCVAHLGRGGDGAAAAAFLIASEPLPDREPLAELSPLDGWTEELRDSWQLVGAGPSKADQSFVAQIGTERLGRSCIGDAAGGDRLFVSGPDPRASARLEAKLGGPGDPLAAKVGQLGAAHAPFRLLLSLDRPTEVLSLAGGCADRIGVVPTAAGARFAAAVRGQLDGGVDAAVPPQPPGFPEDLDPYASMPRSWRDRDLDFRLAGIVDDNAPVPGRRAPEGTVVTWTRDHVYPASTVTDMAVVQLGGGGRFFGQVAAGEEVEIGDRVRLVPRRLHLGGDVVQYFWKVARCR